METIRRSKTMGQRRMALPRVVPWLTSTQIAVRARLNRGWVCWLANISRLRTIGTPASIRAAILLENRALSRTPGRFSSIFERLWPRFMRGAFALVGLLLVGWGTIEVAILPARRRSRLARAMLAAVTRTSFVSPWRLV